MEAMDPKLSVIVPTHNRWQFLSRALASVLSQSEGELEVLVVDDGSSDETPERLAEISDPRVRALRQEPNQGVAAARNRGIAEARAPWVAFLDDDDFWGPDKVRAHLEGLAEAGAEWSYGSAISVGDRGEPRKLLQAPSPDGIAPGLLEANVVGPPSTVTARTALVRDAGGFDENLSVLADWDLWIRLAGRATAAAHSTPHVAYCEHDSNMQGGPCSNKRSELEYLAAKHGASGSGSNGFAASMFERMAIEDARQEGRRFRAGAGYVRLGITERSGRDVLRGGGVLLGEGAIRRLGPVTRPKVTLPSWVTTGFWATLALPLG